jgi:hypothetical protein
VGVLDDHDARGLRHVLVGDEEVEAAAVIEQPDGLGAVGGEDDVEAAVGERLLEVAADQPVVIDRRAPAARCSILPGSVSNPSLRCPPVPT